MMAASIEMLSKPGYAQYSQAALVHQSRAYSIVNQRLRGPDNLTDSTIWIIILLINQEQLNQRFDIAKIHTQGLERVVEMRGGLEQLDHCRPLVLKLCKYVFLSSVDTFLGGSRLTNTGLQDRRHGGSSKRRSANVL